MPKKAKGGRVGRPEGCLLVEKRYLSKEELDNFKQELLQLMELGTCLTISEACKKVGVPSNIIWRLAKQDPQWKLLVDQARTVFRELAADQLEEEIRKNPNIIGKIFLLKGYRPEFKDNYRPINTDTKQRELLERLKELMEEDEPQKTAESVVEGECRELEPADERESS